MSLTAFSQTDSTLYPKTVLINTDTVTQFYLWQARKIAEDLVLKDYYEEIYEYTETQLYTCLELNINNDSISTNLRNQVSFLEQVALSKDTIITQQIGIIDSQASIIKQQNKKAKVKKARNWVLAIAGIVATEEIFRKIYK